MLPPLTPTTRYMLRPPMRRVAANREPMAGAFQRGHARSGMQVWRRHHLQQRFIYSVTSRRLSNK